jgi:hypothetical protein
MTSSVAHVAGRSISRLRSVTVGSSGCDTIVSEGGCFMIGAMISSYVLVRGRTMGWTVLWLKVDIDHRSVAGVT